MGLVHKLMIGTLAGIVYLSSLGSANADSGSDNYVVKESVEIDYDHPENNFSDFRSLYFGLTLDDTISSDDVVKLETNLRERLDELYSDSDKKHFDEHIEFYNFLKGVRYFSLYPLTYYVECLNTWKNSVAVKGEFWSHGIGTIVYISPDDDGRINIDWKIGDQRSLEHSFKRDRLYAGLKFPENIEEPCETFPINNKIPNWLGSLLGLILPGAITLGSKKLRGTLNGKDDFTKLETFNTLTNQLTGYLIFDSIHPLFYPLRMSLPLLVEGYSLTKYYAEKNKERKSSDLEKIAEQQSKGWRIRRREKKDAKIEYNVRAILSERADLRRIIVEETIEENPARFEAYFPKPKINQEAVRKFLEEHPEDRQEVMEGELADNLDIYYDCIIQVKRDNLKKQGARKLLPRFKHLDFQD